jgi:hypothetical protein
MCCPQVSFWSGGRSWLASTAEIYAVGIQNSPAQTPGTTGIPAIDAWRDLIRKSAWWVASTTSIADSEVMPATIPI